jgi:RNA polymerase sigma-70 factor (ECF subfamily)
MNETYRQWVTDHQQPVWSLARHLLVDSAEAEDVSQEAFLRLWQKRDSIDPVHVRPWLLRVTRNLCLDRLRQRRSQSEPREDELFHDSGPVAAMSQSQRQGWLHAAIGALGEPARTLVILRDMQQNSYEDIAMAMDMNLGQVKVNLHRARGRLRRKLEALQHDH